MVVYGGTPLILSKLTPMLGRYSLAIQLAQWAMVGIPIGQVLTGFNIRGLINKVIPHMVVNLVSDRYSEVN